MMSDSHFKHPPLILASRSPRRRELLTEAGYEFMVVPPAEDVECGICSESSPAGLVTELAYRKAAAVARQLQSETKDRAIGRGRGRPGSPEAVILAADTVAECDGFILGKPRDEAEARMMLERLSGREHRVLSGVCLWPLTLPLPPGEGRGEGALSRPAQQLLPADLLQFARKLRTTQSDAESLMWHLLRNRRLARCKFRRQHPINPYVLDFYCHEKRLAIEVDGGQHNTAYARRTDEKRSRFLANQGIRVVRFWNHDVLQDTDTVLEAIWRTLQADEDTLTPNPSPIGRGGPLVRVAVTRLRMDLLSDMQLEDYLASGAWEGKAGAFGYQDRLGWVHIVEGSESNVVGLPMELLAEMLREVAARSGEQGAGGRN
jgi:predicted house-cleaning NTP pyrophosphatase (Maf/HAM1 superfamily)/very-short-patch-repair endonuclease